MPQNGVLDAVSTIIALRNNRFRPEGEAVTGIQVQRRVRILLPALP